jgi:hypothetical protein
MKVENIIITALLIVLYVVSFLFTGALVWSICLFLGLSFSWKIVAGIWVGMILLRLIVDYVLAGVVGNIKIK